MHLLYLDDSGSAENKNEQYLVLGGVCLYESQIHYVTTELDRIAERLSPGDADGVEFHASAVFAGREEPWKSLKKEERQSVIKEVLGVLTNSYDTARAFATVVHKPSCQDRHPMEVAFEDICSRFDRFLSRRGWARADHFGREHACDATATVIAAIPPFGDSVECDPPSRRWAAFRFLAFLPLHSTRRSHRLRRLSAIRSKGYKLLRCIRPSIRPCGPSHSRFEAHRNRGVRDVPVPIVSEPCQPVRSDRFGLSLLSSHFIHHT